MRIRTSSLIAITIYTVGCIPASAEDRSFAIPAIAGGGVGEGAGLGLTLLGLNIENSEMLGYAKGHNGRIELTDKALAPFRFTPEMEDPLGAQHKQVAEEIAVTEKKLELAKNGSLTKEKITTSQPAVGVGSNGGQYKVYEHHVYRHPQGVSTAEALGRSKPITWHFYGPTPESMMKSGSEQATFGTKVTVTEMPIVLPLQEQIDIPAAEARLADLRNVAAGLEGKMKSPAYQRVKNMAIGGNLTKDGRLRAAVDILHGSGTSNPLLTEGEISQLKKNISELRRLAELKYSSNAGVKIARNIAATGGAVSILAAFPLIWGIYELAGSSLPDSAAAAK
jgi:hypothetical protein